MKTENKIKLKQFFQDKTNKAYIICILLILIYTFILRNIPSIWLRWIIYFTIYFGIKFLYDKVVKVFFGKIL